MIALADLFPLEDYRFHLTIRRGDLRDFFGPQRGADAVLGQRQAWLRETPERYAVVTERGGPALDEWARWVRGNGWGAASTAVELGGLLVPDFTLMVPDEAGVHRLEAGVVVFPTSWALEEKVGRTMDEIHGVVPGLNDALATPVQHFLRRLRPGGSAYLRSNWGLAATDQLNLHPSQARPPLTATTDVTNVWLRVEHQILGALPETRAVVFGIRLELQPLTRILQEERLRAGLGWALRTMPLGLARYKGIEPLRERLLALSGVGQ